MTERIVKSTKETPQISDKIVVNDQAKREIMNRYEMRFIASKQFAERARRVLPAGVTHDLRTFNPFPVYMDRALGSHKWDVGGNEFIDYWSGHGAMLLGHSNPKVLEAVARQLPRATHVGGSHELEIEWAEGVSRLVPSAERVRFTGSGTEATIMAIRLARIFTGRNKILKFAGHFHGWHDAVSPGSDPPYDQPSVPGIPPEVQKYTVIIPPNRPDLVEEQLRQDSDIACVILEPTGGHWGAVPIRGEFLKTLRELTIKYGNLLIFDEVITGFRVSPGGAQGYYQVKPDLTSMAKILAGGLPGGGVAGREDVLAFIENRPGKAKMRHPGTYNGNPVSAAAGIAALKQIENGEVCARANSLALLLRNRLNEEFALHGFPWIAYSDFSMFRLLPNYHGPRPVKATSDNNGMIPYEGDLHLLDGPKDSSLIQTFRQALMLQGVDMPGLGGWLTTAHSEADIEQTIQAVIHVLDELYSN